MWCVSHLIPNITNWCIITWTLNEEKWHSVTGSACYFRNPSFNTRNMLTMDGACTLRKPHTEQLVNHPESQFYINAYETSEGKSKNFFLSHSWKWNTVFQQQQAGKVNGKTWVFSSTEGANLLILYFLFIYFNRRQWGLMFVSRLILKHWVDLCNKASRMWKVLMRNSSGLAYNHNI